jgi:hypothetical protein
MTREKYDISRVPISRPVYYRPNAHIIHSDTHDLVFSGTNCKVGCCLVSEKIILFTEAQILSASS